jgi:hypothetical protein
LTTKQSLLFFKISKFIKFAEFDNKATFAFHKNEQIFGILWNLTTKQPLLFMKMSKFIEFAEFDHKATFAFYENEQIYRVCGI